MNGWNGSLRCPARDKTPGMCRAGRRLSENTGPVTGRGVQGSILVVTVFLLSSLFILVLTATETVLLARKAQRALEISVESFYIAEAGLARAQAVCPKLYTAPLPGDGDDEWKNGSEEGDNPDFSQAKWIPFGNGKYFLSVRFVADLPPEHPLTTLGSGILVEALARVEQHNEIGITILLDDPPSCRLIAWWQSRGI